MQRSITSVFLIWFWLGFSAHANRTVFFDDFETGSLDPAFWSVTTGGTGGFVEATLGVADIRAAYEGTYGVLMGSRVREWFLNHLDLHLDLSGYRNLALEFWIKDIEDTTNLEDGLWFSDDGGATFTKVLDFHPSDWTGYGSFPPLDLGARAREAGIGLTSRFVIRFSHRGGTDITRGHGLALDNVHLYEPEIEWATLPFFDDFESGELGPAWTRSWAEQSSKVRPGGFVGVEPGTMDGFYLATIGSYQSGAGINALDLHLDLTDHKQVTLSFLLRGADEEFHLEDGLWFSDDGGERFVKVYPLVEGFWDHDQGAVPPIDLSRLAREKGLELTSRFVIRWMEYDPSHVSAYRWEGFRIDRVSVTSPAVTYVQPPFEDSFEAGTLSSAWAWREPDLTADEGTIRNSGVVEVATRVGGYRVGRTGLFGVRMGKDGGRATVTNALDLHLDLADYRNVTLNLWIFRVYTEASSFSEGIWISDDGGAHFVQAKHIRWQDWNESSWNEVSIDLDSLARERGLSLTHRFVVRLQQMGYDKFIQQYPGGIFVDDVRVSGTRIPKTKRWVTTIPWLVSNSAFSTDVAIFNNGFATAEVELLAVDRDGNERTEVATIPGQTLHAFSAGTLFPGISGYSLHLKANVDTLHCSYLTFNLEPISGGRSPSQTVARQGSELTNKLLFGYVPGSETSALVLTAPKVAEGFTEILLTLYDSSALPLEEKRVQLRGQRPLASLISNLFFSVPADAAVIAETMDGTVIAGTTFVFNALRQPSMAAAIPINH